MRVLIRFVCVLAICLSTWRTGHAQVMIRPDQPDTKVGASTAGQVIDAIGKALHDGYIFPDVAEKMARDLRSRLEKKEFESITSSKELAKLLTDQLQSISHDKHVRVLYVYDALPKPPGADGNKPSAEEQAKMRERMHARAAAGNFGFDKVERLAGNVGCIELLAFQPAEIGGETAASAMNFVANTDALIIDVRKNGGGAPSMVALMCSYLFGPTPVHLNDLYRRQGNTTHQWWTLPYVPGKRYEDKPVYVLTSSRTFSAAEEFTYNLKTQKRATIVGETTGGGANPGGVQPLVGHFAMFVPSGRAINPITNTNWEGTGVTPDVSVRADLALATAHLAALKQLTSGSPEAGKSSKRVSDPGQIQEIKKTIEKLEKELEAGKVSAK
jgi:retinol-binding protein 3